MVPGTSTGFYIYFCGWAVKEARTYEFELVFTYLKDVNKD